MSHSPENKKKKILITGSSGTIGTRLFEKLLEKSHDVIGFDKNHNKWSGRLNRLTIIGDLLKKEDIEKIPNDIDMVVHLAANPRVYDLVVNPDLARDNVITTYNVLEFARKNNIKRIIFSSSRETYGNKKEMVSKETDVDIERCESPYAASKISDEVLIYSFFKCYGINYIICRFSNVYGMYDQSERFIPLILRKMKKNKNIEIFGKDKVLDFTYIDDCVEGIIKCVEKFDNVKNNTFNIAFGKGSKLIDAAKLIKKNLQSKSRIFLGKNRQGEVVRFIADISKAKKMLGYKPEYDLENGIKLTIDWYDKNN
ncbi:MAG: NAD-dependent epimerase/dehydratase family protein [Candidatus Staskawiczbacteria bacterium]|nr:NAD-dependent epimerase/dehydratase family protein [Candidatus Staskawiczbacteria bacterium]MBI3337260.1 NAD-dependent epimerase/dehydratase family protein [Candidatus Staskawiczbacteria bacterium]